VLLQRLQDIHAMCMARSSGAGEQPIAHTTYSCAKPPAEAQWQLLLHFTPARLEQPHDAPAVPTMISIVLPYSAMRMVSFYQLVSRHLLCSSLFTLCHHMARWRSCSCSCRQLHCKQQGAGTRHVGC
jgi:hypothetical protein